MPALTHLSFRSNLLKWAFVLYAVLNLISMATMSIGAALLFVALLISTPHLKIGELEYKNELQRRWSRLYLNLSLILAAACILSLVVAAFWPLGYEDHFVKVHFLKDCAKLWYLVWPLFLVIGLRRLQEKDQALIFKTWLGTFGLLSLIGIFQYFTGWPRPQPIPGSEGYFHATLFLGHHLSVASVLIFPYFVALEGAFRWIVLPGTLTLFLTYSRALWIALPLGVGFWIFLSLKGKMRVLCLALGCLLLGGLLQLPWVVARLSAQIGITSRLELWKANLEFFELRPWTGAGWHHNLELSGYYLLNKTHDVTVFSGHAHNNLIDMLGGTGLLGTFAWLAWNGGLFYILIKKKTILFQGLNFSRAFLCAFVVFHINGITQVNFWEGKVQHQLAWMIAWVLL